MSINEPASQIVRLLSNRFENEGWIVNIKPVAMILAVDVHFTQERGVIEVTRNTLNDIREAEYQVIKQYNLENFKVVLNNIVTAKLDNERLKVKVSYDRFPVMLATQNTLFNLILTERTNKVKNKTWYGTTKVSYKTEYEFHLEVIGVEL